MKNKVAVITGAANGIGFAIAKKFLKDGIKNAILLDIEEEKGYKVAAKLNQGYPDSKVKFIKCDITKNLNVVDEIIKLYSIDVLVNAAGKYIIADRKKVIETNVTATIEWAYKFHDHMRTDRGGKGGTIINLASIYGFRINRYLPTYQASKFAVMGFTRSLGHIKNFENNGVKVIALCPGYTRTTTTENLKRDSKVNNILPMEFIDSMRGIVPQEADVVGDAAVEIYKNADSGTAWVIEDGGPVKEILCNVI
ncbi:hypothetical protein K1T71_007448 [Dendrolimus kikuchii]|uniref:Uncharacterized protein n=1 Tax=Dendrolimus kikuchii TaxID=765133 RepID=A0ACC1D0I0_9NEOP|nr:hypothetical protein K1T71_007448 [Dendrolimus kikuchii]